MGPRPGVFDWQAIVRFRTARHRTLPWLNQHLGAATTFNVQEWVVKRSPALAKYMPSQEQLLEQVGTAAKTTGAFLVGLASRMKRRGF